MHRIILTVKDRLREALDFYTYCLANNSAQNDDHVGLNVTEWTKHLQFEMTTNRFDLYEPFCIISFHSFVQLSCDRNRIHEGAIILLLHICMKKRTDAPLKAKIKIRLRWRGKGRREQALTKYCEVVKYLLDKYATSDVLV